MDDLINDFLAETRDMLQSLSGAIVAWEAEPGDRERLDEIFRFVHTVKGNCGFFDLPRLQQLSHAAEDVLADVRAGRRTADSRLVSAVLAVIDRIGELVNALETGDSLASEDDEQLIAALSEDEEEDVETAPTATPEPDAPVIDLERRKNVRSIRLSVDLLDRMMSGVSDAVLARNELARRLRDAERDVAVEAAFERVSGCIAEIRDAITRTRMQRIDNLFAALPRMVRDLSSELGKQVRLEVDGGDVELDREMIEMIRDPLSHIVRNAIDHGIESSADRAKAGKEAIGVLRVSARQAGNQILIEVADDGRGIDADKLVAKAIAAGIVTSDRAERMSHVERIQLIFAAGLSTAGQVTAISGRGVGMDVVRANIERIGGVVDLDSRLGHGVKLVIRVPLTLTIIPALTVSAGGQIFAIPRSAIEEILRARGAAVRVDRLGDANVATIRGRRVPLVGLSGLLGVDTAVADDEQKLILLKPAGGDVYALAVDAVHDHEELVVKPAAPLVMAAGLYAGTTLADDGRPILLLDPSGMASRAGVGSGEQEVEHRPAADAMTEQTRESTLLLFRGLDGGLRAVPVPVVERIEDVPADSISFTAGRLRVPVGERILPLAGCAEAPAEGLLRILRLTDGAAEIAYGFAEVVDIRAVAIDLQPALVPGEVSGVALIDGNQVEIVDPYWLFAAFAGEAADGAEQPTCALPADDPWMANILRPLIESLGYRVVPAGEEVLADIVIASAEAGGAAQSTAGEVLRIRARPEPDEGDNSIYRYDRAALISALSRHGKDRKHG
ncbi:chemotaxis protein CheA [Sphingosinicella sp. LHD-64]|uniref:chemotaxis protein CheA n=1 Tax=Sphingosinicella sp. LHD-64 TaxID=3072139 RepID=UPI00280C8738|nr:chemotaxis protein CheA [Sphingosinicella sp. LHD-64]MDQ8755615.1 chemotaxis protein CheA [Sphingosinicella sp. LHD-64]